MTKILKLTDEELGSTISDHGDYEKLNEVHEQSIIQAFESFLSLKRMPVENIIFLTSLNCKYSQVCIETQTL